MSKFKESQLFVPVKEFFEEAGYTVYSEVIGWPRQKRADIVATHGQVIAVTELKNSLSLNAIEQAVDWKRAAHTVYIAVPKPKQHFSSYALSLLKQEGLGLIVVDNRYLPGYVNKHIVPKINRKIDAKLLKDGLKEEHKTWLPGGSAGGGYVTQYKIMMENVKRFLRFRQEKWFSVDEILEYCWTHYVQPKQSLANALKKFEADWCENKIENKKMYFRYRQLSRNS